MKQNVLPVLPILLVDDEPHILSGFSVALRAAGFANLARCQDGRQVMELLAAQEAEVVLLDLMMPHVSGQEILVRVREQYPHIPVIILTGVDDVATAVMCMRSGAFDYILKPVDEERLLLAVRRAVEMRQLRRENTTLARRILSERLDHPEAFATIISRNSRMHAIFQYCEAIGEGQQPVLITGETGVGKELIARVLHRVSGRQGHFVPINIAGLDDQVFADTLFGHARGAFTGADRARSGLAEKAADGTLFLDEIGDLSEPSQVKLLRFLEGGEYYPLGTDLPKSSSARVLAATSRDLEAAIQAGRFRRDLYFRLRTHHIHIPPLRERVDDIPLLCHHFLEDARREFSREPLEVESGAMGIISGYGFPGNVRELKALIFNAVGSLRGNFLPASAFDHLPRSRAATEWIDDKWVAGLQQLPTLKEAADILVRESLRRTGNNQRSAAMLLGISPQALNQRLKKK
jgi:DNA-binding NtrC family response regulator